MQLIDLFLTFLEEVLDFEILGFSLYTYLVTVSVVIIAFTIIHKMIKSKE